MIFRRVETGSYMYVGEASIIASQTGDFNLSPYVFGTVWVEAGDLLGIHYPASSGVNPISYDLAADCSSTPMYGLYDPDESRFTAGQVFDMDLMNECRTYSMSVTVFSTTAELEWTHIPGHVINYQNIVTYNELSSAELCKLRCLTETSGTCLSADYGVRRTENPGHCALNMYRHTDPGAAWSERADYDFYEWNYAPAC